MGIGFRLGLWLGLGLFALATSRLDHSLVILLILAYIRQSSSHLRLNPRDPGGEEGAENLDPTSTLEHGSVLRCRHQFGDLSTARLGHARHISLGLSHEILHVLLSEDLGRVRSTAWLGLGCRRRWLRKGLIDGQMDRWTVLGWRLPHSQTSSHTQSYHERTLFNTNQASPRRPPVQSVV